MCFVIWGILQSLSIIKNLVENPSNKILILKEFYFEYFFLYIQSLEKIDQHLLLNLLLLII